MLQQVYEIYDREPGDTVTVVVREYDDFRNWATTMEPDYNRYTYDCVDLLIRANKLPADARESYDSPDLWAKIESIVGNEYNESDPTKHLYELGKLEYINKLCLAILCGDAPPLLAAGLGERRRGDSFWDGPEDGRHRTLAAISIGLRYAPVIDLRFF
jgi:hypothetical protein